MDGPTSSGAGWTIASARRIVSREMNFGNQARVEELPTRIRASLGEKRTEERIDAMSASAVRDAAAFLALAEPQLFVSDIQASIEFYTRKLGFHVRFAHGDPPFYGQLFRDAARLNLRHVDRPVFDARSRAEGDLLSATIVVDRLEALFLEYRASGVAFHQPISTQPWGARNFIVADPDGNLIAFAGDG
jgi:catechol 2,3-dioxygenase-like lactoylglutathione lyase family enzyme